VIQCSNPTEPLCRSQPLFAAPELIVDQDRNLAEGALEILAAVGIESVRDISAELFLCVHCGALAEEVER